MTRFLSDKDLEKNLKAISEAFRAAKSRTYRGLCVSEQRSKKHAYGEITSKMNQGLNQQKCSNGYGRYNNYNQHQEGDIHTDLNATTRSSFCTRFHPVGVGATTGQCLQVERPVLSQSTEVIRQHIVKEQTERNEMSPWTMLSEPIDLLISRELERYRELIENVPRVENMVMSSSKEFQETEPLGLVKPDHGKQAHSNGATLKICPTSCLEPVSNDGEDSVEENWHCVQNQKTPASSLVCQQNDKNFDADKLYLVTLEETGRLDGEVINEFLKLIVNQRTGIYAFNTYFGTQLIEKGYDSVRKWTKKVDIFSMDILLIPHHLNKNHWCLGVVDLQKKTLMYHNSFGSTNADFLNFILKYLQSEMKDKKSVALDVASWRIVKKTVPQQSNDYDCGVFTCMFAEYASRNAEFTFTQDDMESFRKKIKKDIIAGHIN